MGEATRRTCADVRVHLHGIAVAVEGLSFHRHIRKWD